MATVKTFENVPNVQDAGTTDARFRTADFGQAQIGEGIQKLGAGLSETAAKMDEVADVQARIEANRLAVQHSDLAAQIGKRVKQSLGEDAYPAAEQGITDLKKGTDDILAQASPRAKLLLQNELHQRNTVAGDGFLDHGFSEQNKALLTSSEAKRNALIDAAVAEPDEHKALAMLAPINDLNATLAKHFGWSPDVIAEQEHKDSSTFFKQRALQLGVGPDASASAVIEYATKRRKYLTAEDYYSITSAYQHDALGELADHIIDGAPLPSATTAETPNKDGGPQRQLDPRAFFDSFVVPHEGSAYTVDSNGKGVKYGINEGSHPGVDVKNLTKDQAYQIFKADYWDKSGADKLAPALAALHADTYYMNPKEAGKLLRESGGDPDKYAALRTAFLNSLATSNPAKYAKYQKAWTNRTNDLKSFADRQGTDGTPLNVSPDATLSATKDAIMARTDIGSALKHMLIERIDQRRASARQDQEVVEQQAAGKLMVSAASLGDNFTDVKQLPQDAWLAASDETRARLMESAKNNKEQKPLNPKLAAQVGFLQTFAPQKLADPHVLSSLAAKGVPQKIIAQLAEFGGKALGQNKLDQIDRGTLEALAKDPFKAAGFDFWSTEANKKKNPQGFAAEEKDEANRRVMLMNFLQTEAASWALANPNKKADVGTMQKWIATSLIRVGQQGAARPFGSLTDTEVINAYGQKNYTSTAMKLRANGIQPTPANIATYLRRLFAKSHGLP
jgi:hypothetical protein